MEDLPSFDFNRARLPRIPPGVVKAAAALIVVATASLGTLYQVQPEEVGVVLRFGRYVRTTEPGLRAKLPFVEEVLKVPVQRQLKQEFGFRTIEADVRSPVRRGKRRARRRGGHADRRPERGGGGVDRAVPRCRSLSLLVQGQEPRRYVPRDERGIDARGGSAIAP